MSQPSLLAYATSTFNVTDRNLLNEMERKLKPKYQFRGNAAQYNKNLLNDTTLKRACCMGNDFVNVRIPSYRGARYNLTLDEDKIAKENNYLDVRVKVNRNKCPSEFNNQGSVGCQSFYRVYCTSVLQEFISIYWKDKSKPFPYNKWVAYKKECACFSPEPEWMKNFQFNIPPKCVIPDCLPGGNSFLDDESQGSECKNLTYCQQNLDVGTVAAIEGSAVDVGGLNMVNNCGQNSALAKSYQEAKQQLTNGGTVTPAPTPTPTPSPVSEPSFGPEPSPVSEPSSGPEPGFNASQTTEQQTTEQQVTERTPSIFLTVGGSALLLCCLMIIIIAVVIFM